MAAKEQERASQQFADASGTAGVETDPPEETESIVVPLRASRREDPSEGEADGERSPPLPWTPTAARLWRAAKLLSWALALAWLVAWPVGTTWHSWSSTGTFALRLGYGFDILLWTLTTAGLVRGAGYAVALAMRVEASAQSLARTFGSRNASVPGDAARRQVAALNREIDEALRRLAEAESLIRQQVRAIDSASDALENGTVSSTQRLEEERKALIHLTEEMNREADRFAETLAARGKAATDGQTAVAASLADAEKSLSGQIDRLESMSMQSLERFERLAAAMHAQSETFQSAAEGSTENGEALAEQMERNAARIQSAQADLAEQSERLEKLLTEQRARADRVAQFVTEALPEQMRKAPDPQPLSDDNGVPRQAKAWRDILQTVERALPTDTNKQQGPTKARTGETADPAAMDVAPADGTALPAEPTGPSSADDDIQRLVVRVQNYSLVLQTQLFGTPDHEELDRFEEGERQIFAKALIAGDERELRQRIAAALETNSVFRDRTMEFLRDFDRLLEAVTAEDDTADAIEDYLATPMGKLYLSAGSAAGHFPAS